MAQYPSLVSTFTTKTNEVDDVDASHVNILQDEVIALQTYIGTNPHGSQANLAAFIRRCFASNGAVRQGTGFPGSPNTGDIFYRTDQDLLYKYNGTGWTESGTSKSDLVYCWTGNDRATGVDEGLVSSALLIPTSATGNYSFFQTRFTTNRNVLTTQYHKIAAVNTLKVYAKIWQESGAAGARALAALGIGALASSAAGTINQSTPEWVNFTLDVSSLSSDSYAEMVISLKSSDSARTAYLASVIVFGLP